MHPEKKLGAIFPRREKTEDQITIDLSNLENYEEMLQWMKSEVESFAKEHSDYMSKSMLKEQFEKIARSLAKKLNITIEQLNIDAIVKCDEETNYPPDEPESGTTEGTFSLLGKNIFDYYSFSDGYNFRITGWLDSELKTALPLLIQYLKDQGKN